MAPGRLLPDTERPPAPCPAASAPVPLADTGTEGPGGGGQAAIVCELGPGSRPPGEKPG